MTYDIVIDDFIGSYGYTKTFVAQKLDACKKKTTNVLMNSMGGSLDHGLNICERFGQKGNVTVDLIGFNASAATLATLKANKIRMSANGFYLIHKAMNGVDIYGNLNADQMQQIVDDLSANIEENNKIDAVIAQMYTAKTGKPIEEMLALMKVGGWLNATEALNYGFVDEIIPTSSKLNFKGLEEKFNAFGLPTSRITTENLFTNKNKIDMTKQPLKINAILGVEKLEKDDEGVFLNEAQIDLIDAQVETLENSIVTEQAATTAAIARAETAENAVTANATKITELEAQIVNLKAAPGATSNPIAVEVDSTIVNAVPLTREEGHAEAKKMAAFL